MIVSWQDENRVDAWPPVGCRACAFDGSLALVDAVVIHDYVTARCPRCGHSIHRLQDGEVLGEAGEISAE